MSIDLSGVLKGIRKILPVTIWLPAYRLPDLKWDMISGTTLAFFAIPTAMAYANLAGLSPEAGIYSYLFAGLLYFFFGTSRQLAIGPTSAMSIVVASSIGTMAEGDPAKAMLLGSAAACIVAGLYLVAYIVRLSSLINFISDTILTGFKAGAALVIAATQLPKLLGVEGGGSTFYERIWLIVRQIGEANPSVIIFGLVCLVLLQVGNHYFKGKPVSLVIVILSILVVSFTTVKDYGILVVGEIPKGIPGIRFPVLDYTEINDLLFLAIACFFLSYVESISAARSIAREHGYEIDARQELLALGAANLASSLGSGFTVAGGLSQSRVNEKSGAKSLVSLLFTSVVLGISLLFLTGLFKNMPQVILAVIVLDAVAGLINIKEMKHLFRVSRPEFWVSMLTILAVVSYGVLEGIFLAALLSIVVLLKLTASPHIAILGRIPGTSSLSDLLRHPDNIPIEGVLILRPEAQILYYNIQNIREKIKQLVSSHQGKLDMVILDLSSASSVDVSGARYLVQLEDELEKKRIRLRIVDALGTVRDILRSEGMEREIGRLSRRITIQDVLDEYQASLRKELETEVTE